MLLVTGTFAFPLVMVLALAVAALRRRAWPMVGAASPWVPASVLLLLFPLAPGTVGLDAVLLGSQLALDAPSIALALGGAVLFVALGYVNRGHLAASEGSVACFLLAWAGALAQSLAGDLLLYLTGAATAGLAMLALTVSLWDSFSPWRASGVAAALLAGDLALLELATLLVEGGSGSHYRVAAATLAGLRGDWLVEFCVVLGLGLRVALPLALLRWSDDRVAALQVLPGWLAVAACSVLASWRLAPAGLETTTGALTSWTAVAAWALLLLPVLFLLPAALRLAATCGARVGEWAALLRNAAVLRIDRAGHADSHRFLSGLEARLTGWPLAMSLLVVFAVVLLTILRD